MIRNINESFGGQELFFSVTDMAKAITDCGYELPESGLQEGTDYEVLHTTYTETEKREISMKFRDTANFNSEYGFFLIRNSSNRQSIARLAILRIYYSRSGATCYAALWIHGSRYISGAGRASGYGYDKQSAAAYWACVNAGMTPAESFNGTGINDACNKLTAIIADYLGENPNNITFFSSHA